ncbi:MAG TPA: hypothetical protein VN258_01460 [Mobilitalea sp.]|nr:hypothetical protein [Mobilitalea sp.]
MQSKKSRDFVPASGAVPSGVGNNQAEIIYSSMNTSFCWQNQEQGMEYCIVSDISVDELTAFVEGLSEGEFVILVSEEEVVEPQIKVDVDLVAEENEQESVDAGHSPWKLDPVFVTQVFASLLLSPEGIVGDYPIAYNNIEIIKNNGTDAVAEIKDDKSIAKYVYLKRLERQVETGIWSVVGYDPAK